MSVLRRIFLETKSIRACSDTRKQGKKNSSSSLRSFDCEFGLGGEGKGRLEAYGMTDEEAAGGAGRTEASSILVAMHHGMWMVEGRCKLDRKGRNTKSDGSPILSGDPFPTSDHSVSSFAISIHPCLFSFLFLLPLSHLSLIPIFCTFIIFYCILLSIPFSWSLLFTFLSFISSQYPSFR